jgi:hypothetical protein
MTYGGVTCLHDRDAVERNIGAFDLSLAFLKPSPSSNRPRLKRTNKPKYQWLDFAKVSPFFLW